MEAHRRTQKDVAIEAGVTQATVSMALRSHPDVSSKTRDRVQAIAKRMGYFPDPYLAGLSIYRKSQRPAELRATLAWLANNPEGDSWRNFPAFRGYYDGASRRAHELGYRLEEHRLRAKGMTAARLEQILVARNIGGLLLAPQPQAGARLDFCLDRFSAVTFGYTLAEPQLHLVTLHGFRSMEMAFRRLVSLGYRRPGLALALESDRRADRNWSAAFWSEQRELPPRQRIPSLLDQSLTRETFLRWYKRYKPDVVLAIWPEVYRWLIDAGVKVPEDTGFTLLTVPDEGALYSGIWENPHITGARAVEFLIDLLHRNECGCPAVPLSLLVTGTWVDGKTVRVQNHNKQP